MLRHLISASLITFSIVGCAAPRSIPTTFNAAQNPTFQRFSTPGALNANWFEQLPYQQQNYYQQAQGKQGEALFSALHNIIQKGHRTPSYNGARSFMYGYADQVQVGNQKGLLANDSWCQ